MSQLDLFSFSRYLLLIAHPDDEINCAVFLHRLISQGRQVKVVLLTNGDAGVNAAGRTQEMAESMRNIGLSLQDLLPLDISEKKLLDNATHVYERALQVAAGYQADCILGIDYEGGHEGHDMASFVAHKVAQKLGATHVVYPDSHFRNMRRHGTEFLPGRQPDYTLKLNNEDQDLKISLLEAHCGQIGFHLRLQKNQDNYFGLLFSREVYRIFPDEYDFLTRPDYQIAYEHHRNGFTFSDFVKAAKSIK